MALRRMFSKAVVSSARFMKMPVDSQNLYFHLGMAADDDGVVEAWSVLKTVGSAEDNLKVLASKGFIRVLNEDLVSYILDWNEHNMMRADRLTPSAYRELLVQMIPDVELAEPKKRADRPLRLGRPGDNHGTAEGRVGEDRITGALEDSQRVVEVSDNSEETRPRTKPKYPNARTAFSWFREYEPWWDMNTTQLKYGELSFVRGEAAVRSILLFLEKHKDLDDCPQVITPYDLETKWKKVEAFAKRNGL